MMNLVRKLFGKKPRESWEERRRREIMIHWRVGDKLHVEDSAWMWGHQQDYLSDVVTYQGWNGSDKIKVHSFKGTAYVDLSDIEYNGSLYSRRQKGNFESEIIEQAKFDEAFRRAYDEISKGDQ